MFVFMSFNTSLIQKVKWI